MPLASPPPYGVKGNLAEYGHGHTITMLITILEASYANQSDAGKTISGFEECQQISVELIFVCVSEPVGCTGVNLQGRVLNKLR